MNATLARMDKKTLAALKTYAKSFLAVILGLFLASGADVFSVSSSDLKAWLAAGLSAILPVIITALDPSDGRYGRGSAE